MLQHHGLLWEYYRKGMELVPLELKPVLDELKAFADEGDSDGFLSYMYTKQPH